MAKLFAKYKVYQEVPENGDYNAEITDIQEYRDNMKVEFTPFDYVKGKLVRFAPVFLRINNRNNCYSAAANFIEIFEDFNNFESIIGNVVGVTIKANTKDGVLYHNVVDVFLLDDDEESETSEIAEEAATEEEEEF